MLEQDELKEILIKLESPFPICRVCLNDTLEYIDFETSLCFIESTEVTYFDAYKVFTPLIHLDQNLPSRLCVICADALYNAFLFLRQVEKAEIVLKRLKIYTDSKNVTNNEEISMADSTTKFRPPNNDLKINVTNENVITTSDTGIRGSSTDTLMDTETCFQCKDCGKMCTSEESYRKHCLPHQLARCNPKIRKSIKCKQCGKSFKLYGDLEKHLLIHAMATIQMSKRGKLIYECNLCHKNYQSVFSFVDHMHIHNGTKPYKCSICSVFRHTKAKLKSHKYHTHGKGFELRLAAKDEKNKLMQTEPLRFKTKCRYCDKVVVNEVIKRHEKMHENPDKRFQCSVCLKRFYTEQNLHFHSETHLEIRKPFKCTICGQEILRQYSLKLHMQRHASEEKKFKCDICGTVLSAKGSLTEHREKHFSDSRYKCDHCDKTFIRKSRLVYHIRSHTGENPFKCNLCDKSFKMRARLRIHVKVKHSNQTYDCDKCNSKFKSYGGLVNHKFVHTGYPFECPQCNKGVSNRERLKKHLLRVHKGYMTCEKFDQMYPKRTEIRKVQVVDSSTSDNIKF